jgi:hypothetical protein
MEFLKGQQEAREYKAFGLMRAFQVLSGSFNDEEGRKSCEKYSICRRSEMEHGSLSVVRGKVLFGLPRMRTNELAIVWDVCATRGQTPPDLKFIESLAEATSLKTVVSTPNKFERAAAEPIQRVATKLGKAMAATSFGKASFLASLSTWIHVYANMAYHPSVSNLHSFISHQVTTNHRP